MTKINLLTNEYIIFKTRRHFLILLYELSLITFVLIVSALVLPEVEYKNISLNSFLSFVLFFAATVEFLDWWFTRFYLTNNRVIRLSGIIGRSSISIPLDKIQDISYDYGILGRILGFGDLVIESAGNFGRISFQYMPSPWRVRSRIQEAIDRQIGAENIWPAD